jgi:hypothetical protein
MIETGTRVAAVSLWTAPNERKTIGQVLSGGRGLFLFYLFDWSAT